MKAWFKEFESLEDDNQKQQMVSEICLALTVHAQIEEEIFYPAVRAEIDDDDLMDEAEVEHASAKQLIAEIQRIAPLPEALFDQLHPAKTKRMQREGAYNVEDSIAV